MKPIKLTMSAFGPYKNKEEIDFNKINDGLLLITGDTGAGKTTIFDAISYAIYGEASGSNRKSSSLRSDFATEEIKSYVELEFIHSNNKYLVKRFPKQLRKKARGEGYIEEKEKLELIINDDKIFSDAEANEKLIDIMSLTSKQFKQVSMLSQGEFTKLLFADENEKTLIFRKIFNTEIFNKISYKLKEKLFIKKEEYDKETYLLNNEKNKLDFETSDLTDEELLKKIEELKNNYEIDFKKVDEEYKKINNKINELSTVKKIQNEINENINLLNNEKNNLTKLINENKNYKNDELIYNYNKNALTLLNPFYNKINECKNKIEKNNMLKINYNLELEELNKKIKLNEKEYNNIDNYTKELDSINTSLIDLNNTILSITNFKNYYKDLLVLITNFKKVNEDFDFLNNKYRNMEELYYNSLAGILALKLENNKPCLVCGSVTHPSPAKLDKEVLTKEELDILKEEKENKESEKNNITNKIDIINTKLESELIVKNSDYELEYIKNNIDKIELDFLNKKDILNNKKISLQKQIEKINNEKISNEKLLSSFLTKIDNIKNNNLELENEVNENKNILENNYLELKTNEEEYKNNLIDINSYHKLEIKINNYNNNLLTLKTKINSLENITKEKVYKDINYLNIELEKLEVEKTDKSNKRDNILNKYNMYKISLDNIKNNYKKISRVSDEYLLIKTLSDTANGYLKGKHKIIFENYVQSSYLNIILNEANKRLSKMTDSRYELRQKEEVLKISDKICLDFQIYDSYTGKKRDVTTLSGGESFKASLSLALGLSDVIQNYAGGVKVDTMFIDEGFGSLDPESIDQALNILTQLSENNRLIGLISHVEQLKNRIDKKIIVTKTSEGSKVNIEY